MKFTKRWTKRRYLIERHLPPIGGQTPSSWSYQTRFGRALGAIGKDRQTSAPHNVPAPATPPRLPEPASDPVLVTVREAMRLAGLGRTALYLHLSDGDFIARKAGRRTLIVYASLREWMEALPTLKGAKPPK
jgi:Helix-turn-helix domain